MRHRRAPPHSFRHTYTPHDMNSQGKHAARHVCSVTVCEVLSTSRPLLLLSCNVRGPCSHVCGLRSYVPRPSSASYHGERSSPCAALRRLREHRRVAISILPQRRLGRHHAPTRGEAAAARVHSLPQPSPALSALGPVVLRQKDSKQWVSTISASSKSAPAVSEHHLGVDHAVPGTGG
mmetsp:Transcript_84542/g.116782  ORF Transcript_84542/g.116782 Transcript_84542/m.116782 type:complete len:178 (+) Transcript_84542:263-796(+)